MSCENTCSLLRTALVRVEPSSRNEKARQVAEKVWTTDVLSDGDRGRIVGALSGLTEQYDRLVDDVQRSNRVLDSIVQGCTLSARPARRSPPGARTASKIPTRKRASPPSKIPVRKSTSPAPRRKTASPRVRATATPSARRPAGAPKTPATALKTPSPRRPGSPTARSSLRKPQKTPRTTPKGTPSKIPIRAALFDKPFTPSAPRAPTFVRRSHR